VVPSFNFISVIGISIGAMFLCGLDTLIFKPETSGICSPETVEVRTLIVFEPTPSGITDTSNFACSENNVDENPNVVL